MPRTSLNPAPPSPPGNESDGMPEDGQVNLKQVKVFLALVNLRSITKAAAQLHMSPSGFSRAVRSLEAAMGDTLFTRSAQGIVLTEIGTHFLPHARALHSALAGTLAAAASVSKQQWVLAGCDLVLPSVLPGLFRAQSVSVPPGSTLLVNRLASHQVLQEVAAGRADLGLCMCNGMRDELVLQPLLKAPLGLLAHANAALPGTLRTLDDLGGIAMIRVTDDMLVPLALRSHGVHLDAYFRSPVIANDMSTVMAAVGSGRLASVVSAVAASCAQAQGLRFIPLPDLLPWVSLCTVTRPEAPGDSPHTAWLQILRTSVHQLPWLPTVERVAHL